MPTVDASPDKEDFRSNLIVNMLMAFSEFENSVSKERLNKMIELVRSKKNVDSTKTVLNKE